MHRTARRTITWFATATLVAAPFAVAAASAAQDRTFESITGTPRSDQLLGHGGIDVIRGLAGADVVRGARGIDFAFGGDGSDTVSGGRGSDIATGGPGRDAVTGGPGSDYVVELGGDDVVTGGPGLEWIALGTGADVLHAGERGELVLVFDDRDPDTLRCGPGRDLVVYFRGVDSQDRLRGCERVITQRELDFDDLPPVPPVLATDADGGTDGGSTDTSDEEPAPEPRTAGASPTREQAYRAMARQLLASTG